MADLLVIEELATYLVAQGVGQRPSATPSLTVPSIWLLPRDGAGLPRAGENVTVTLSDTNIMGTPGLTAWLEETFVDVIVRSKQASAGKMVQRQIKLLLVPWDAHGGRKQWMMGGLLVEASNEWRGDQPLPQSITATAEDAHVTYDRVASYRFTVRRKILAGSTLP